MAGEVGTLRPGAAADVAVLRLDQGAFELFDIHGEKREYHQRLSAVHTIRGGREMDQTPVPAPPPWIRLVDLEPTGACA